MKPIYSNFETSCQTDIYDDEIYFSDDQIAYNEFGFSVNENGLCTRCIDLNPYCITCPEEDGVADKCDLCYNPDTNRAFLPNEAIHSEYENTCSIPDCVQNIPGTQICQQCAWFNFEQLIADLSDQNADNDFLSIPNRFNDYFHDYWKLELIP